MKIMNATSNNQITSQNRQSFGMAMRKLDSESMNKLSGIFGPNENLAKKYAKIIATATEREADNQFYDLEPRVDALGYYCIAVFKKSLNTVEQIFTTKKDITNLDSNYLKDIKDIFLNASNYARSRANTDTILKNAHEPNTHVQGIWDIHEMH